MIFLPGSIPAFYFSPAISDKCPKIHTDFRARAHTHKRSWHGQTQEIIVVLKTMPNGFAHITMPSKKNINLKYLHNEYRTAGFTEIGGKLKRGKQHW